MKVISQSSRRLLVAIGLKINKWIQVPKVIIISDFYL